MICKWSSLRLVAHTTNETNTSQHLPGMLSWLVVGGGVARARVRRECWDRGGLRKWMARWVCIFPIHRSLDAPPPPCTSPRPQPRNGVQHGTATALCRSRTVAWIATCNASWHSATTAQLPASGRSSQLSESNSIVTGPADCGREAAASAVLLLKLCGRWCKPCSRTSTA